jgi:predicted small lipoprotein YifL
MTVLYRYLMAAVLALSMAGCGVRGSLERPPGAAEQTTATAESGQGKKQGEADKPHKDSFLDGLLR